MKVNASSLTSTVNYLFEIYIISSRFYVTYSRFILSVRDLYYLFEIYDGRKKKGKMIDVVLFFLSCYFLSTFLFFRFFTLHCCLLFLYTCLLCLHKNDEECEEVWIGNMWEHGWRITRSESLKQKKQKMNWKMMPITKDFGKEKKLWEEIRSGEKSFQKREESSNVSHE